jgi:hypothetical protein
MTSSKFFAEARIMATWLDDFFLNPRRVGMRLGAITATFGHELDEPQFIYSLRANMDYFPARLHLLPFPDQTPVFVPARYSCLDIQVEKKIDFVNVGWEFSTFIRNVQIIQYGGSYFVDAYMPDETREEAAARQNRGRLR